MSVATRADVSRLLGRAAFGATKADLDKWTGQPYDALVHSLFPPGPPGTLGRLPQDDEVERLAFENTIGDIYLGVRWWLERMRITPYPLEERLTLFWHDHFATAFTGQPDLGLIMKQNGTLRTHALGSFRSLANAMSTDGAMLFWLNGVDNHVDGVNENYAREFLELFTLGTVPQVYTETDIREAAKAFTGFIVNTITRQSTFTPARHDTTVKLVLGRRVGGHATGSTAEAAEYAEVTEAALAHDGGKTASRFVAWKLIQQLGFEVTPEDTTGEILVEDVAWAIRAGGKWDIGLGLRRLLTHPRWRYADPAAGRRLVRSPVEMLIHATKVLGFPKPLPGQTWLWPVQVQTILERAGQTPFLPPNVGGWPHGGGWLSQTTNLGRYDLLLQLVTYWRNLGLSSVYPMPPSGDIDAWASYMGLGAFGTNTRLRLGEYLQDPKTTVEIDKQVTMFLLAATSPEWQVM
ncbi:MAG TPA: DUF1800 family protein [Frankiaceae bacterium]|nr:DUF1800 family protein [Frankiaceae bacterium]